ncbi:MAG: aminotransferase class III-fold pyridoxal phosphate-dependent enzyme, partial [Myxococcota bacterium]
ETIEGIEWCAFGKNGSDVTAYAVQTAREHTQRRKILKVKGAYHGSQSWCRHGLGGLIESDYEHVLDFSWNDAGELEDLLEKHEGDVACVVLTPYHHPAFADQVMPAPGFLSDVQALCRRHGAVLISDDVRAGFRLDLRGSHVYFGFQPDISCYYKAMANGYAVSACCGTAELKNAASKVFFTGTYYTSAPEQAAALACLAELERTQAIPHMMKMGEMLMAGLKEKAAGHGIEVRLSGPPSLPFMTFAAETNFRRSQLFSGEAAKRGVIFHPHHNWFIMRDHTEADIRETLDVADECFAIVKKEFGS